MLQMRQIDGDILKKGELLMDGVTFNNLCVGSLLAICTGTDIKSRKVSVFILLGFGIAGIAALAMSRTLLIPGVIGGIGTGAVVAGISIMTRGAVGMGDGLLLMVTGIYLGFWGNVELLAGGLFLAAVYSIFLLVFKKAGRNREMPFIPFLFLAFLGMVLL